MYGGYQGGGNRSSRGRGGFKRGGPFPPRSSPSQPRRVSSTPARDMTADLQLNSSIATLNVPVNGLSADITNVQYIGSYNWLETTGTIVVPGSPREWLNKATPYVVREDTEEVYVDQNGHRIPKAPLLPLMACVDSYQASKLNPNPNKTFDWSSIDIITDRNGLRKLLRWVRGEADNDFRIDLQLAGKKTVLFTRWEKQTKDYPQWSGTFGHNFEDAATKEVAGCEGSSGHHRVVQYDFGGLKMVVRSEVDAYYSAARPATSQKSSLASPPRTTASVDQGLDEITSALQKTTITPPAQAVSTGETALSIREAGTVVAPQESIAELKTVSQKKYNSGGTRWEDILLQMTIAQTPYLFLGVHDRGNFTTVKTLNTTSSPELKDAAVKVKSSLLKLRRALDDIGKLVVAHGESGRLSLVCRGGKVEMFRRKNDQSCLPAEFLKKFQ